MPINSFTSKSGRGFEYLLFFLLGGNISYIQVSIDLPIARQFFISLSFISSPLICICSPQLSSTNPPVLLMKEVILLILFSSLSPFRGLDITYSAPYSSSLIEVSLTILQPIGTSNLPQSCIHSISIPACLLDLVLENSPD